MDQLLARPCFKDIRNGGDVHRQVKESERHMPIWSKGGNTASKGLIGHIAILNALMAVGKEVLIPWGDHRRYDLAYLQPEEFITSKGPRLIRVQCKVARISADGGYISFNAYSVMPGEKGRRSVKKGYEGDAEIFGVYSPDTGKVYLIPVSEVPPSGDVKLRLHKAKKNQEKGVHWAKDYEI